MRDGVRLAADIYRPARGDSPVAEPLPVILERTPYGKTDAERAERCRYFAQRGYVFVAQDCRGCYESEGDLYFLAQEPNDGYDTVEWIAEQPWCNGSVGTMGTSYMAWTQSALATQNPPHLACIFPNMGGWNAYTSSVRHGGTLELRFIAWALWHSATNTNAALKHSPYVDLALEGPDFREWLTRWPIKRGQTQLKLVPGYEKWAFDLLDKTRYDDYWKQPGFAIEEYRDQHSDVPMHFTGGWYDSYTRASLESYVGLSEAKDSYVRVTMGPWTHGTTTPELSYSGDVEFGPDAALDRFDELHQHWFDRWLKGNDNGVDREPPVRIFVMGGGDGRKNADGTHVPRRPVEVGERMAARPHGLQSLLHPRRRHLEHRAAERGGVQHDLRLRPGAPCSDHRGQRLVSCGAEKAALSGQGLDASPDRRQSRADRAGRCIRPAGGAGLLRM